MKKIKHMRGKSSVMYSLCVIVLVFAMTVTSQSPVLAALTNDFIEESEGKKKEAEDNKKAVESKLSQVKQMLKEVQNIKSELDKAMVEADAKLEDLNDSIEIINADIIEIEDNIATTQAELIIAESIKEKQYYLMKKRIQYMYEKGNKSYIELLFTSGSFSDFLNTAEFVNKLSKYDREMLESYMETCEDIEDKEQKLLDEEAKLKEKQADLNAQQQEVEDEMEEKQDAINMYSADINNKEAAIQEYEAYIAEQKAVVEALEAAILAEKKRLAEENQIKYDGGKFAWPAPKYVRISDDYGYRTHPILGTQQFHNGVDMAAPGGSPILAAYDGEVVAADYSATMGNYVMINHGDGLITIYMHASQLEVSKGQTVVRGEEIAKVGTTGRSTGNHLHFSVRENGSYVSPWKFIS